MLTLLGVNGGETHEYVSMHTGVFHEETVCTCEIKRKRDIVKEFGIQ